VRTTGLTVKEKQPGQRACDEKNAKGEMCCGHLKRWYTPDEATLKQLGVKAATVELYRCERCHTLYRPAPGDDSSAGLKYDLRPVNILGIFGRKRDGK
jgi:hypothetical protein